MARLALEGTGDSYYLDQFLFHVILDGSRNRRWQSFRPERSAYLAELLENMLEHKASEIDNELDLNRILEANLIWQDNGR